MRIAFIVIGNSRRSNYLNGYNLRYGGGGGSGTDTSSILVAEYLAKQGHEVVFAREDLEPNIDKQLKAQGYETKPGQENYGVKYTNMNFEGVENLEFDILISMLWFQGYKDLKIKVTKSLIYWSHMQWIYGLNEIVNFVNENNLSFAVVNISDWEKTMNKGILSTFEQKISKFEQVLIPNPVFDEIITEVLSTKPKKKDGKFVFHASWPRGGSVAYETFRLIDKPNKEFHAFDYLMVIHDYEDPGFYRHQGVDKITLFSHLAESEYFIYPLYTPYQDVHKDTFSCVVAEAIALGAIPITYPLGALPEIFSGFCKWIDMPDGVDAENLQKEQLSKDLEGKFKLNIQKILNAINDLENNPAEKEKLRRNATEYILNSFSIESVGEKWITLINKLSI